MSLVWASTSYAHCVIVSRFPRGTSRCCLKASFRMELSTGVILYFKRGFSRFTSSQTITFFYSLLFYTHFEGQKLLLLFIFSTLSFFQYRHPPNSQFIGLYKSLVVTELSSPNREIMGGATQAMSKPSESNTNVHWIQQPIEQPYRRN